MPRNYGVNLNMLDKVITFIKTGIILLLTYATISIGISIMLRALFKINSNFTMLDNILLTSLLLLLHRSSTLWNIFLISTIMLGTFSLFLLSRAVIFFIKKSTPLFSMYNKSWLDVKLLARISLGLILLSLFLINLILLLLSRGVT